MPITLYGHPLSPPFRACTLTARMIGLDLVLKNIDLIGERENMKDWFLKMNPAHTIPTLDDNGFYMWESRAIMGYMVQQYGKDDKLYPKDPKKRAVVDTMLYFDVGTLYTSFADYYYSMVFYGKPEDPEKKSKMLERLSILDTILGQRTFAAGDQLTLADLSIISSLTTPLAAKFDYAPYKNIVAWMARVKSQLPFYDELNAEGIGIFTAIFAQSPILAQSLKK